MIDLAAELGRRDARRQQAFDSNEAWKLARERLDHLYQRWHNTDGEAKLRLWLDDIVPLEHEVAQMARDDGYATLGTDPLTEKGNTILKNMEEQYGSPKKAKQVLYASKNKGTITGIDAIDSKGGRWGGRSR